MYSHVNLLDSCPDWSLLLSLLCQCVGPNPHTCTSVCIFLNGIMFVYVTSQEWSGIISTAKTTAATHKLHSFVPLPLNAKASAAYLYATPPTPWQGPVPLCCPSHTMAGTCASMLPLPHHGRDLCLYAAPPTPWQGPVPLCCPSHTMAGTCSSMLPLPHHGRDLCLYAAPPTPWQGLVPLCCPSHTMAGTCVCLVAMK